MFTPFALAPYDLQLVLDIHDNGIATRMDDYTQ